jgi:hypothetical protein
VSLEVVETGPGIYMTMLWLSNMEMNVVQDRLRATTEGYIFA